MTTIAPTLDAPLPRGQTQSRAWESVPPRAWLALGALLLPLSSLKWNLAPLAWVAAVPFLVYLRRVAPGIRGKAELLAALLIGANLMTSKLITEPVPWLLMPGYGIPIALGLFCVYLMWDFIARRSSERWALYAFPAMLALAETASYRLTPFGTWGALANTQLDDDRLVQLASLVGVGGIGFVMAWVASFIALLLTATERRRFVRDAALLVATLLGVYAFGSQRLFREQPGATVRVAGIVADLGPTPQGLPSGEAVAHNTATLFARSDTAARRGARLIVWNEAATVVLPADEADFIARGQALASAHRVDLVLAYIVPIEHQRYVMENKYVFISDAGEVLETYHKHHPVPAEGSVPGTAALQGIDRPYARLAGAICYDYDFPEMSQAHGALGAGLVFVPSSDWRGIDPYHTQMARLRAIEGGYSLIRPVRWATSGAFDAFGRSRATMSHFEQNDRIIEASLPTERVPTLYASIGDAPVLLYLLIILGAAVSSLRRGRERSFSSP